MGAILFFPCLSNKFRKGELPLKPIRPAIVSNGRKKPNRPLELIVKRTWVINFEKCFCHSQSPKFKGRVVMSATTGPSPVMFSLERIGSVPYNGQLERDIH